MATQYASQDFLNFYGEKNLMDCLRDACEKLSNAAWDYSVQNKALPPERREKALLQALIEMQVMLAQVEGIFPLGAGAEEFDRLWDEACQKLDADKRAQSAQSTSSAPSDRTITLEERLTLQLFVEHPDTSISSEGIERIRQALRRLIL